MSIDIGNYPDVSKQNLQDGFSYMDNLHNSTNEGVQKQVIGEYVEDTNGNSFKKSLKIDSEHMVTPKAVYGPFIMGTRGLYAQQDTNKDIPEFNGINVSKEDYSDMLKGTTMISNPDDMLKNRFGRFSRYGYIDLSGEYLTGTREYLFFSKPDLHLFQPDGSLYSPLMSNPFLVEAFNHYRFSFYQLQQSYGAQVLNNVSSETINLHSKFIPILSNMCTSTLDLGDITASDVEGNRNLYQINTTYREGSITSDLGYDFSIEFKDTKYLDVYTLFKIYDEYCRHKYMTEIEPVKMEYIMNKIYPEALSVWKIIVDDTDRIMYWAKATGCTPMSVPRGSMSNFEGIVKLTINWKAQFVKDMDPMNLLELNNLTKMSLGNSSGISFALPSGGETWVGYPYIVTDGELHTQSRTGDYEASSTQKFYKLVWIN